MGLSIDEDHYEQMTINDAFNSNYIWYESKRDKDKSLAIEDYFNEIEPYLSDMINKHNTHGEWEIQLTTVISLYLPKILMRFVPCLQKGIMLKSWWVENQMKLSKNFLNLFLSGCQKISRRIDRKWIYFW